MGCGQGNVGMAEVVEVMARVMKWVTAMVVRVVGGDDQGDGGDGGGHYGDDAAVVIIVVVALVNQHGGTSGGDLGSEENDGWT